jgi:hypothetical protein
MLARRKTVDEVITEFLVDEFHFEKSKSCVSYALFVVVAVITFLQDLVITIRRNHYFLFQIILRIFELISTKVYCL